MSRRGPFSFLSPVFLFALLAGPFVCSTASAQSKDQVTLLLSARHLNASPAQLEKMAGGPDALVKKLLGARLKESTPFLGVRAAKMLLQYTHYPEVLTAIGEDIAAANREGLARVYAVHIDEVREPEARKEIARRLIDRAGSQPAFRPFARIMQESRDPEVAKLVKENLS